VCVKLLHAAYGVPIKLMFSSKHADTTGAYIHGILFVLASVN
jgi:hypothetical protein